MDPKSVQGDLAETLVKPSGPPRWPRSPKMAQVVHRAPKTLPELRYLLSFLRAGANNENCAPVYTGTRFLGFGTLSFHTFLGYFVVT